MNNKFLTSNTHFYVLSVSAVIVIVITISKTCLLTLLTANKGDLKTTHPPMPAL